MKKLIKMLMVALIVLLMLGLTGCSKTDDTISKTHKSSKNVSSSNSIDETNDSSYKDTIITEENFEDILNKMETELDENETYYFAYIALKYSDSIDNIKSNIFNNTVEDLVKQGKKEMKEDGYTIEKFKEEYEGDLFSGSSNSSEPKVPTIKVGETWEVEGQWKLTINSVKRTSERNEFSDKNPTDVVYITYSYENLGYEDSIMDGLYISLDDGQIIDEQGEMGYSYPNSVTTYPQETPVGAKCVNAQVCIGLNNKSNTFTINYSEYDDNYNKQKVKFVLDIE